MLKSRSPYDRGGSLRAGYPNPFVIHLKTEDSPPKEAWMA